MRTKVDWLMIVVLCLVDDPDAFHGRDWFAQAFKGESDSI